MKRIALLLTLSASFLLPRANLRAEIQVLWSSPSGSIRQDGGVDYAPATWMAQLIYAGADDVKAPLNPASPFVPGGDDRVLRTQEQEPLLVQRVASPEVMVALVTSSYQAFSRCSASGW